MALNLNNYNVGSAIFNVVELSSMYHRHSMNFLIKLKMAVPECNLDTRTRENNNNKAKMEKIQQKRQLLEHQELNLAKALAGNDQKLRDKALKSLKKWMVNRSQALRMYFDLFIFAFKIFILAYLFEFM